MFSLVDALFWVGIPPVITSLASALLFFRLELRKRKQQIKNTTPGDF